jgi:hypothetical protein
VRDGSPPSSAPGADLAAGDLHLFVLPYAGRRRSGRRIVLEKWSAELAQNEPEVLPLTVGELPSQTDRRQRTCAAGFRV